ncbi:MAG: hypothetical protein ACOYYS_17380 [Chloroflexota bacterium]
MKNRNGQILLVIFFALLAGACGGSSNEPVATIDVDAVQTYVAETAALALTMTREASSPTPPPTPTSPPTETPLPSPTTTLAPTPTGEPLTVTISLTPTFDVNATATLAPVSGTGERLSLDDFEHGQAWFTEVTDDYSFAYDQGGYRIRNRIPGAVIYSVQSLSPNDVRLEVDANALEAADGAAWGMICRYTDAENYYAFVIGPDNMYGIAKNKDGQFQFIKQDSADDNKVFEADENEFIHLRADCVGNTLSLTVNETLLLQVSDADHTTGKAGLLVKHSRSDDYTDVLFDNFAIWRGK